MTRDSYSNYQKAISAGAPQAVQVTDRWHLLKNLGEAVQKVLVKQYSKTNAVLASKPLRAGLNTSSWQTWVPFWPKSMSGTAEGSGW